ncbi:MAG: deoxyribose-phosphate aldolase [Clostridia bacterium]|nr:deoxyribose-phosphate aldolase [Clostridia bacterium]
MDNKYILRIIDHTMLKAEASEADIIRICDEAKQYHVATVFTHGYYTPLVRRCLEGSDVRVGVTAGFPFGAQPTKVKVFEAKTSILDGADEVDMVLNIGAVKSGKYDTAYMDMAKVREACGPNRILKVILETCLLTDDEIVRSCELAVKAGLDFVKTSTGLSYGGATVEHVKLMKSVVGDRAKVKAAGGIRTVEQCRLMIEAGAERIGTSSLMKIAEEIMQEN